MPTSRCALPSPFRWMVLLSALVLPLASACPATCVVSTRAVTLCHQLTYIVGNKTNNSKKAVLSVSGKLVAMAFVVLSALWAQPDRGKLSKSKPFPATRYGHHYFILLLMVVSTKTTSGPSEATEIFC